VGGDDPVDNETLLVIDFMNLKIKSAQSFGCTRKVRVYVCVLIGVSTHTCISIYVCIVFLKKWKRSNVCVSEKNGKDATC
jgi:hypothetical protein